MIRKYSTYVLPELYYFRLPFRTIMQHSFYHLVSSRESVRSYRNTLVEKDTILRIMEAGRLAPSACNAQPWTFIVVDDPDLKTRVADAASGTLTGLNHFARQAPVIIVVVMEPANLTSRIGSVVKQKHYPLIDIGIATEHICLAAAAEGLGTCMIGWFDESAIRSLLGIPRKSRPVLLITLGYPSSEIPREKRRKPLAEVLKFNRY